MNTALEANVFFHPVVLKAWTDARRSVYDLQPVYCIAEKDGVTFFLPLVIWKRNWKHAFVKMLVPAGYPDFDYHDPVIAGHATKKMIDSFWAFICKELAENRRVRFDEASLCGIHGAEGDYGSIEVEGVCPYTDMNRHTDFASFFGSLRKSFRKDIERQQKRLSEAGFVRFKVFEREESEQVLAALPAFLAAHSRRWPAAFKSEGFYERLIREALPEGILHFSEIQLDDKPISWHFGFSYNKRFYYYMPVFVEKYSVYSPGKIHLSFLLQNAYMEGIGIFDFLRGAEDYKKEWANAESLLYGYTFRSASVSSCMRLFAEDILKTVKKRFFMASL